MRGSQDHLLMRSTSSWPWLTWPSPYCGLIYHDHIHSQSGHHTLHNDNHLHRLSPSLLQDSLCLLWLHYCAPSTFLCYISLDVEIDDSLVGQLTTSTHAHSTISTHRGTFVCSLDRFGRCRCMRTTLFSPPAKFSRRCYSALADSHRQPHTCTSVQF